MEENLKKMELFFKYNLAIKNTLVNIAPSEEYNYNESSRVKYGDKLYFSLVDMEDMFNSLCDCLNNPDLKKDIKEFFSKLQNALLNAGYSYQRLSDFYKNYLSDMSPQLVEQVKGAFVGHTLFSSSIPGMMPSIKTINELLHVFHQFVINNENVYEIMPKIAQKDISGRTYTLYGEEWPVAENIMNSFSETIKSGWLDMISLPKSNKIILMARDLGHATTVEIDIEGTKAMIRYFIPKICNPIKVNTLKGVNKVPIISSTTEEGFTRFSNDIQATTGQFEVETTLLQYEISNFLASCPTDDDMFTYGGWSYHMGQKYGIGR